MRRIGAHVSSAGGLNNIVTNTIAIGGNCAQIFAGSPRMWLRTPYDSRLALSFVSQCQSNDISPIFIHALYLVNLATDNQELLHKSINSIIADLKNGALIHSNGVIVHIGSHQGRGFDFVKDSIVVHIQSILSQTENIDLILENDAGQNGKIGSIEELKYLSDNLNSDRIKICLDTAHLFESGLDIRDKHIVENFSEELVKLNLLDKLVCLHLNDSKTILDSHRDMHANIGEGEIGKAGLSNFVNHPSFQHLPLILEVPGANKAGPDKLNIDAAKSLIL